MHISDIWLRLQFSFMQRNVCIIKIYQLNHAECINFIRSSIYCLYAYVCWLQFKSKVNGKDDWILIYCMKTSKIEHYSTKMSIDRCTMFWVNLTSQNQCALKIGLLYLLRKIQMQSQTNKTETVLLFGRMKIRLWPWNANNHIRLSID